MALVDGGDDGSDDDSGAAVVWFCFRGRADIYVSVSPVVGGTVLKRRDHNCRPAPAGKELWLITIDGDGM